MAIPDLDTTFKSQSSRFGDTAYQVVVAPFEAATDVFYTSVPFAGTLVRVLFCNGATASDGSNYYDVTVVNASNSDAAMISAYSSTTNDVAAYGTEEATLSTTAANLAVDAGDCVEVTATVTGTVTDARVILYFENSL